MEVKILKQQICLNGEWKIKGTSMDGMKNLELAGLVPGHIHLDLLREGLIKDYFWRDQAEDCQWVEDWEWFYEKEFEIPADFDLSWVEIEFEGLDTYAAISLNGEAVAKTCNMFVPHRIEVGDKLQIGKNTVTIKFSTVKKSTEGLPLEKYLSAFTQDRVFTRRMQCTFSWDWVNRFVSYGIWRPVTLYAYRKAFIEDMFIYAKQLDESSAAINLEITCSKRISKPLAVKVEILDPGGKAVVRNHYTIYDSIGCFSINIKNPELWWPNGYGNQPLYICEALLVGEEGKELDTKRITFGIRTVHIEQLKDVPGSTEWEKTMEIRRKYPSYDKNGSEPGSSFTLIVNGERIFCKGGNWVPCDPFPSRIPEEHYDRLIKLARDGNMNMLRCWGGGIYEAEAFWNACDRYGIMVTQDFLMACAWYPEDDPAFMEQIYKEIFQAVKMLRNHTSLVWWSGDNENGMNGDFDDPCYNGRKIADTISGTLCSQLDPSRPFLPTSPYGGRPNTSMTAGNTHYTAFIMDELINIRDTDMKDFHKRIQDSICRFASETATLGAPPINSLLTFMTMQDIESKEGDIWHYHTKNNPYFNDLTLYDSLKTASEKLFGKSEDTALKVMKMEYVQYEWVRYAVEAARMNKWYCSGLLFWMYNDCWPASGWSMVDYFGFPKAGYYAMRKASKPVIVMVENAENTYNIWVCSDNMRPVNGELNVYVQHWEGEKRWNSKVSFYVYANISNLVMEINKYELNGILGRDNVLVCEIAGDFWQDRALYYIEMPYKMELPPVKLNVHKDGDNHSGSLTISTDYYARVVTLEGEFDFTDNYFDLLPGETKSIGYSTPFGTYSRSESTDIRVKCWNQI